jgi:phospholipase D1/2
MGVLGPCVVDITEHFVLRWNLIKRDKYQRDGRYNWLIMEGRDGPDEDLIGVQRPDYPVGEYVSHPLSPLSSKTLDNRGTVHAQVVRSSSDWSSGILTEHSIQNAYCEVIRNAQHYIYIENQFFITATGDQQAPIKNTIGRAIVDAVVRAGKEGRKFRVIAVIPAIPGFTGDLRHGVAAGTRRGPEVGTRAIMNYQYQSICRGNQSIFEQIRAQGVDPAQHIFFFNLRSYDRLGVTTALERHREKHGVKNRKVQTAEAQQTPDPEIHSAGDQGEGLGTYMTNYGDYDEEQRTKAKRRHETAEEPVGSNRAAERTGSVAKSAMYQMPKLEDELQECDMLGEVDNWVQEELYVHAKLLIADDKTVICGSSNLNDRSQLGFRDSELSIIMTDTEPLESKMDGQEFVAGRHAATLRRYLWREHLGLLPPQDLDARSEANAQPPGIPNDPHQGDTYEFVADPLGDEVWRMWTSRATQNTKVFGELFHADPDNCSKHTLPLSCVSQLTTCTGS